MAKYTKKEIHSFTRELWYAELRNTFAVDINSIDPHCSLFNIYPRITESSCNSIILNRAGNYFKYLVNISQNSLCLTCNTLDDSTHILLFCSKFNSWLLSCG